MYEGSFWKVNVANGGLAVGVWILIGFYEWEVRGDGSKTCDLLEIYTPIEKDKLKQLEAHNLAAIMNIGELEGTENEFTFSKFKEDDGMHVDAKHVDAKHVDTEDIMSSSDEEKEVIIEKKKETLQDQMDWLTINERDI